MSSALAANIGTLISAAIVLSTLYRELQPRVIVIKTLWGRPAVLALVTLALAGFSIHLAPHRVASLVLYGVAGSAIGAIIGLLLARTTQMSSTGNAGALQVRSSGATIAIWIAVLLGRFGLRFVLPASLPIVGLDQNVASLTLVTTAFTVLAIIFANTINTQTHIRHSERDLENSRSLLHVAPGVGLEPTTR